MRIAEIFESLQGEGKLLGIPSVFVRVSGCNLRCRWCDTPYASWKPEGREMTPAEIEQAVLGYTSRHVVITGGEPLIMPELESLCFRLAAAGKHITIETAGTRFVPLPADLISLSPKLASSTPCPEEHGAMATHHEENRIDLTALQRFIDTAADVQLKFVILSPSDVAEVEDLLGHLRGWNREDVLLMPEGTRPEVLEEQGEWLAEACRQRGFRFCPRLHVMIWGNRRGV